MLFVLFVECVIVFVDEVVIEVFGICFVYVFDVVCFEFDCVYVFDGLQIQLVGDFGVGKIIFVCVILCGFGYQGCVCSLIYMFVELYVFECSDGEFEVYYFDLY